jgi:hypothetical protein
MSPAAHDFLDAVLGLGCARGQLAIGNPTAFIGRIE